MTNMIMMMMMKDSVVNANAKNAFKDPRNIYLMVF